ncbi:hypothetical protein KCP73_00945 [Salmonella enterica subsp. enterica]|nr:hypothetical protein KCP73_00945 [Salmonella enterica subsp. enterica]
MRPKTSQVLFALKENQTYNAKMIPILSRDHVFYTAFAQKTLRSLLPAGMNAGEAYRRAHRTKIAASHLFDHGLIPHSRVGRAVNKQSAIERNTLYPPSEIVTQIFRRRTATCIACPA